jgi:hypothetical protein
VRLDETSARTLATVIVGAAALGAAVIVLRTPALRRLAFGLARTVVTVTIPVWLSQETQQAWAASGQRDSARPPSPPQDRSA